MKVECYDPDSIISELSYGQWTVKWWQWALSIPRHKNPVVDRTGRNAGEHQPDEVWFLAGIWADDYTSEEFPSRECKVPVGSSLLIPVLNCEADPIEYPEIKSDQDIIHHVSDQMHKVIKKECYLNEQYIPPQRVRSDPVIFELQIHNDFARSNVGGRTKASADGYWVFLKPLPKGNYNIRFEGSYEYGKLSSGAKYNIHIR
jgi:hypothetical protein